MSKGFVFIHGFGQGSWVWDDTIAQLQQQSLAPVRALALDVPGCGTKRGISSPEMTVDEIVAAFLREVKTFGENGDVLVGHSLAGILIPRLVRAAPDHFSHVAYVSCVAPIGEQVAIAWPEGLPEASSALPKTVEELTPERLRAMFCNDMSPLQETEFMEKLGADNWPAAVHGSTGWDYEHLQLINSTYIYCMKDMTLPIEWQRVFAERLQVQSTEEIEAGHQVMNTKPDVLAATLLKIRSAS